MYNKPPFLLDLLHICEIIAFIAGIYKYNSLKKSYWKWFVFYLFYIVLYELIHVYFSKVLKVSTQIYFSLIQLPLEFIFFYWLFAYQSLKKSKLFLFFVFLYINSLILEYYLTLSLNFSFKSISYTFGTLLFLILIVLEFIQQIKSDTIIEFKSNKMFYINIGVILFYIGNMPFFGWYYSILKIPEIWNSYYIYFMISNCIMYLLFAASFIWGKVK